MSDDDDGSDSGSEALFDMDPFSKDWADLSPEEQAAAAVLGGKFDTFRLTISSDFLCVGGSSSVANRR